MKYIIYYFLTFMAIFGLCRGQDWQAHWTNAVHFCDQENYQDAYVEFTTAILEVEDNNILDYPHVYVDRARVLILLNELEDALIDVETALESDKLIGWDKTRALITKMFICNHLGMDAQVDSDYELFVENYGNMPVTEFTDSKIIIRNVPDCACYRNMVKHIMLENEMVNSEADIVEFSSNVIVANRKPCNCGCKENKKRDKAKKNLKKSREKRKNDPKKYCLKDCKKAYKNARNWCLSQMKDSWCQASCMAVIQFMAESCERCCDTADENHQCTLIFTELPRHIDNECEKKWD